MIKKILSYIIPISVHKQDSQVSTSLEVLLNNGRYILDTPNTNYSYGSLQRILRFGLKKIGFVRVREMERILVMGLAGGSVVRTLIDEIGYQGAMTAVELDSEVVDIANKYFIINDIDGLDIVIDDAQNFVKTAKQTYDLIIVDIFQDNHMPDFLFSKAFINQTISLLNNNGIILFNTMKVRKEDAIRNLRFIEYCKQYATVKVLPNVEGSNELLLIFKKGTTS
ncbi:spermidine synthase [Capnocytophaga canis]|uniref:spermidine synthase n=1 Tax=Capnocytophaga canis TaxID=1848903 RepID=UPI00156275C3|nr:fused MFS/spermidine synthase [Capnocytophaga canis]